MLSELTLLVLLLSSFDDPRADVHDVSLLVMAHGFQVTYEGIVTLEDGSQYQIEPNGDEPGLANLRGIYHVAP